jgi:hypothetical protein
VAEGERPLERHRPAHDPGVEVAGSDRKRPQKRLTGALELRVRRLSPLGSAGLDEEELLHRVL